MHSIISRAFALLLVLLVVAASVPASAQSAGAQENITSRARRVDSLFAEFARPGSPGLAVAVVRDGGVVFEKGYGFASLEHGVPITPSTVFDVASVSKQFAGLTVAMLVEQGRIRLDDDIRKYIPELPDFGHRITVDHLVHHTSGIRDWPGTLALAGWRFDDVIAFDQILRMAYAQRTLNFVPGAEYTYSNTGYNLLAEMVARVTGQSFRTWTDAHFFRPLGMTRSHFHDDHQAVVPDRAFGYVRADSGYRLVGNALTALGSSSLFSTVQDLARWVANFEAPTVGGAAAMTRMRTRGVLNDGSRIPYAFGVSHAEHRGQPTVYHGGSWAAFSTFLLHFPQQRTGVIVLANTPAVNASRAAHRVADVFLDSALAPVAAAASSATSVVDVPPTALDALTGVYRLGPGWYVRIRREGRTLLSQATDEDAVPMTPRSSREFWVAAYDAPMAFERDSARGTVTLLYRGRRIPRLAAAGAPEPTPAPLAEVEGVYDSAELGTSYTVRVRDGALVMEHWRHGTIPLVRAWGDDYSGAMWFLRSVHFQRDASGRVAGLVVNVDERSRDIRFTKRR